MNVRFHDVESQQDLLELDLSHVPRSNEHVFVRSHPLDEPTDYVVLRVEWDIVVGGGVVVVVHVVPPPSRPV